MSRSEEVLGGLFFGHAEPRVFTERSERGCHLDRRTRRPLAGKRQAPSGAERNRQPIPTARQQYPAISLDGEPDGDIFWYNNRWFEYTGMSPESQFGWGWESVQDPQQLPRVREKWQAALASGEPWEDTFPLRRHDNTFRSHLSRAAPFRDSDGNIHDVVRHKHRYHRSAEASRRPRTTPLGRTRRPHRSRANRPHER